MPKHLKSINSDVTKFVDSLKHPFREEIERLRRDILEANSELTENIKWNGPNYSHNNDDRITMRIQPMGKQVQLIFHRGAKVKEQPREKLIRDDSGLLAWKENDRAIATFKSMKEIESRKLALTKIVADWIDAAKM